MPIALDHKNWPDIDVSPMVPEEFAQFRTLTADALAFFRERLSAPRLTELVARQCDLPADASAEERLADLISQCSTLHKLGQVDTGGDDSWFGNNGLLGPLRARLGERVHLLSRLRVNTALYALPEPVPGKAGRPRKYGKRLGNAAELAAAMREQARAYTLHVYGAVREVVAAEQVVMLKTLRCPARVV
jgi:hypothetical protein